RTLRVGERSGTPLEDLGVQPDHRIDLTRNDLIAGNQDLLDSAADLLAGLPLRRLDATVGAVAAGTATIEMVTDEIGRVDVYLDDRPFASLNVREGSSQVDVPVGAARARLEGYSGSELVVANHLDLPS
ncbi:MAG: peptidase S41, partial [Actinomycetota bacterium]